MRDATPAVVAVIAAAIALSFLLLGVMAAAPVEQACSHVGMADDVALLQGEARVRLPLGAFPTLYGHTTSGALPLMLNGSFHFVARASYTVDIMGFHIHGYDVALYLDADSPLWAGAANWSHERKISEMLGNVRFVHVIQSRLVTRRVLADVFARPLPPIADSLGATNFSKPVWQYKQLFLDGPRPKVGSQLLLAPSATGAEASLRGRSLGQVRNDLLGIALLQAYLGNELCELPEFRDAVFAQLAEGKPAEITDLVIVRKKGRTTWWGVVIWAIALTTMLCCCCFFTWLCCCNGGKGA